jgi:hypothetical protein
MPMDPVIVWPDHDAPGQSYAEQIAIMLHRDFDTAAQIVPISDVFLCKVTGQTLGETIRDGMLLMPWPEAGASQRSTASLPLP